MKKLMQLGYVMRSGYTMSSSSMISNKIFIQYGLMDCFRSVQQSHSWKVFAPVIFCNDSAIAIFSVVTYGICLSLTQASPLLYDPKKITGSISYGVLFFYYGILCTLIPHRRIQVIFIGFQFQSSTGMLELRTFFRNYFGLDSNSSVDV